MQECPQCDKYLPATAIACKCGWETKPQKIYVDVMKEWKERKKAPVAIAQHWLLKMRKDLRQAT